MDRITYDPQTSQYCARVIIGEEAPDDPWSCAYFDVDVDWSDRYCIKITEIVGPDGAEVTRDGLDMDYIEQQCIDALGSEDDYIPRKVREAV